MPVLAAAFYAVIGVMSMGHEYRYGTNKATLTALPDRITVLVGKMVVLDPLDHVRPWLLTLML